MSSVDGDAEEGDNNGDFGRDAGNGVQDLTEPPALELLGRT